MSEKNDIHAPAFQAAGAIDLFLAEAMPVSDRLAGLLDEAIDDSNAIRSLALRISAGAAREALNAAAARIDRAGRDLRGHASRIELADQLLAHLHEVAHDHREFVAIPWELAEVIQPYFDDAMDAFVLLAFRMGDGSLEAAGITPEALRTNAPQFRPDGVDATHF